MITLTGYADQHPTPRLVISGEELDHILLLLVRSAEMSGYVHIENEKEISLDILKKMRRVCLEKTEPELKEYEIDAGLSE
jgi:hypothetical protein